MSDGDALEVLKVVRRIEELLTAVTKQVLANAIEKHLSDTKRKTIYQNVERLTFSQLSQRTGFSHGKISGLCKAWEEAGLLIKTGKKYRRLI